MSMDKKDWYFDQPVREDELDSAFEFVSTAFDQRFVDMGWYGIAPNGFTPADQLGVAQDAPLAMTVVVAKGRGYTKEGKRLIRKTATDKPNLGVDLNGAPTVPGVGNDRYVSLFILPGYSLSDDRVDGNAVPVKFNKELMHTLEVVAGVEAAVGTAVKPALRNDALLLCDVLLNSASAQIIDAVLPAAPVVNEIDLTRSEKWEVSAESMMGKVLKATESLDIAKNLGVAPTVDASSKFYAEAVPRAWATVDAAGAIIASYNVLSTAKVGAGTYDITLPTGLFAATNDICPMACMRNVFANGPVTTAEGISATVVRVFTWIDVPGWGFADSPFNIVIWGRPAIT